MCSSSFTPWKNELLFAELEAVCAEAVDRFNEILLDQLASSPLRTILEELKVCVEICRVKFSVFSSNWGEIYVGLMLSGVSDSYQRRVLLSNGGENGGRWCVSVFIGLEY